MKIYLVMDDDIYGQQTPCKVFRNKQNAEEYTKGRNFGVADLPIIEMDLED